MTFQKLDFELELFRVGQIKTIELYKNNPIEIKYEIKNKNAYDKLFYLKYFGENQFLWSRNEEVFEEENKVFFNDTIKMDGFDLVIEKNVDVLFQNSASLRVNNVFAFRINSQKALVASVNSSNYFVRSVDKKIQIIKPPPYEHSARRRKKRYIVYRL